MKRFSPIYWGCIIALTALLISADVFAGKKKDIVYPMRPKEKIEINVDQVYAELVQGATDIDWTRLDGTLEYVRTEYDCSDFRLVNLVRILYEYKSMIPDDYLKKIEDVLFNFRYWWDEPGENSMCYWSENHQILFATAEYLIGQLYPDTVFPSSGLTGKDHMVKARKRAMDWLKMRWKYGFIEYNSNVYYKEDIGPLINLIDFAKDEELVNKVTIITDLLFFDMAMQTTHNFFISASGRAYQNQRTGINAGSFGGLTDYLWGEAKTIKPGLIYGMTVTDYRLPSVLNAIAKDSSTFIIKQSNGLNLEELKTEGYYGTDNRSMMMQWGMEAFTNAIVIRNSLKHIRSCNMFSNAFLSDFKMLDVFILDWLHLEPTASRILNPQYNGVAIQKGNTYTYKTNDYTMYTVQSHHPGDYADQQHVFGMNIKNHFAVFHMHPAREKGSKAQSPNYWVGYGHFPHSVQDKNVNLSIYNIPKRKGMMESTLLDYTRAFFPLDSFDEASLDGKYLFGKKGDTYCAMIACNDLKVRDDSNDDIIQEGKKTFWITEAGCKADDGSYEDFVQRIKSNSVTFNPKKLELSYVSNGNTYDLTFDKDFKLNGEVVDTNYKRFDSPFAQANKKDSSIAIEHKGQKLFLDFNKQIREF